MNFISRIKDRAKKTKQEVKVDDMKQEYDIFIERPKLNFLIKLYYMIIKNIKLLIRSKFSSLIYILGPLLIIFLVALSFNTSTLYDLNVAVYSDSYTPLTDSITSNLSGSLYNVVKLNSEEDCIDAVKFQDFQVCLIFPSGMALDNSVHNVVNVYVDNSRLNIAHLISSQIGTKVNIESSELSTELVTELLTVIDNTNTQVETAKPTIDGLIASSGSAKSSVAGISSSLENVDFSFDSVDTSAITSEINSIKASENLSSSLFSDLNTLVVALETSYSEATSKFKDAGKEIDSISSSVPAIASSIDGDKIKLDQLKGQLQTISEDIDTVKITNVESIVSPIKTQIRPISSANNYLLFILPSILVVLIMFVALLMSSASIIQEKTSQAYFRNFITPTNENLFMLGEFLSNFMVLTFQIVLIMGVLFYFLQDIGYQPFLLASGMLLLVGTFFIILGMFIGYIFNSKQTVTLASLTTAIIMLFFSNTLLPLETLSSVTRNIVFYNPFLIGESILKKIFIFGAGWPEIAELVYILIGFSLAVLIGAILARRFSRQFFNLR
jgi:ABC-type multidrug transport system permease subunit